MLPSVFPPASFPAHALLDCGAGEKLERFGERVLRRPDPQALWRPRGGPELWEAADLVFVRESDRGGRWEAGARARPGAGDPAGPWPVRYGDATFLLRPTPFKHVGLFPEQAANWEFVRAAGELLQAAGVERPRLLNLFGYTGAASVLARQQGWEVTHVDASKASLGWLRENLEASGLGARSVRILCDDALGFARREVRRGSRYEAVLLDPPHYGRGPKGERWQLEEGLAPLVEAVGSLLVERGLLVLSTYAVGYSPLAFRNLLAELPGGACSVGELALAEEGAEGRHLPAGFCARWWRGLELEG